MVKVELIYDSDCPNVDEARSQLRKALCDKGLAEEWTEWDRNDPNAPRYVLNCGSPTILVNRKDVVTNSETSGASCCRIYTDSDGNLQGVPSIDAIRQALVTTGPETKGDSNSNSPEVRTSWIRSGAALPGIGAAFLPGLTCPACWPAYAGLLSSLGLGFIDYTPYLLPITGGLLAMALLALGFGAKKRQGYGPFVVGTLSAGAIILGRFSFARDFVMYTGIAGLILASIWNSVPKRISSSCSSCAGTETT